MKRWAMRIGAALAVAILGLSVVNAQWLAPEPKGSVKLVARHGIAPVSALGNSGALCKAAAIEEPFSDYLPNTVAGITRAHKLGNPMVLVDVTLSGDGKIVLFGSEPLECATDGAGPVSGASVADLKLLDAGYRFTADGGQTFPLRGKGIGQIATLAELLPALQRRARLLYRIPEGGEGIASVLAAELALFGRDPAQARDGFTGDAASLEILSAKYPASWIFDVARARDCSGDYRLTGWTGVLPASCRGGTMIVPLNDQAAYWGWPARLIARMEEYGGEIVMIAPGGTGDELPGITLNEQLGEVPASFNGYLMVDDALGIAPALHTRLDNRTQEEIDAAFAAMAARRSRQ